MHLRRADLERSDTRATPDDYYYGLAEEIKKLLPAEDLDFHVWSSPKNIPAFDYHFWKSEDFDGYRQRGMTVHLDEKIDDNDDMLKAWVHMSRADIFIMSQSSFSMVPAYMNTNCVIFPVQHRLASRELGQREGSTAEQLPNRAGQVRRACQQGPQVWSHRSCDGDEFGVPAGSIGVQVAGRC